MTFVNHLLCQFHGIDTIVSHLHPAGESMGFDSIMRTAFDTNLLERFRWQIAAKYAKIYTPQKFLKKIIKCEII